MRRIQLAEMAPHVHSFRPNENKTDKLSKWLISWIVLSLRDGKIRPFDLLPSKGELACHIGVSLGTMQNVYRFVEDAGYIESKQKVGSYIKERGRETSAKLTSKKDLAGDVIKKFLKDNDYKTGDALPSTRRLSAMIGISNATIRTAIAKLVLQGILEKRKNLFILTGRSFKSDNIEAKTLVDKISDKMKRYIKRELKKGDRIPPSMELASMFNVSIKTIHDAVKQLCKEGILYTRRGKYGTIVIDGDKNTSREIYNYEKIEQKIREYIVSNCNTGDKLPPIKTLSKQYETSEKTVKKALDNLAEEGYITFMRGRYGGTFVTDIPRDSNEAYTWLAVNSEFLSGEN